MAEHWGGSLKKLDAFRWLIPEGYKPGMRVPGIIYADEGLLKTMRADQALEQVANVACLPGIVGASLGLPDIHWGYGFPIGGVGATRLEDGVITPGGIGFDINCGVRLLTSNLTYDDVKPRLKALVDELFRSVPAGVGSSGKLRLDAKEMADVLQQGSRWALAAGFGWESDVERTEERGQMKEADAARVSAKAIKRGAPQLGSLGSGNHFLEVQVVDDIYDRRAAEAFGIHGEGQVTIQIHVGSRGLGHQVCTDYLETMGMALAKYKISVPDRQLACAPLSSAEGRDYFAAMACAANYAWANRQCITHWVRETFGRVFGKKPESLGLELVYDVAHNIAKMETHVVDGKELRVCVHRKGATRAFPPNSPELPEAYREVGQPVLVPGDMGRSSYLLVGTDRAMRETFGSACHGAGRLMSRSAALKDVRGSKIRQELEARGILVRAPSDASLAEEAPEAYKDVGDVVRVTHGAGVSLKVARMRPMGVVKG